MNFGAGRSPSVANQDEVEKAIIINKKATPMQAKEILMCPGILVESAAISPEFQTKTDMDFVVIVLGGALAVLALVPGSMWCTAYLYYLACACIF